MSDLPVTSPPARPSCSGDTYFSLPAKPEPISVPSFVAVDLAMPKSMILAFPTSPSTRMMLSGEMSRWMTPSLCAACSPPATRWRSTVMRSSLSGASRSLSASDGPDANSIERYGRFSVGSTEKT